MASLIGLIIVFACYGHPLHPKHHVLDDRTPTTFANRWYGNFPHHHKLFR